MARKIHPSIVTLPIESVYHILDYLEPLEILLSVRDVCSRLNAITATYAPYQVGVSFDTYRKRFSFMCM